MNNKKMFKEVKELISNKQDELSEEKKVVYDKSTKQFSIKIPKKIAVKLGLKKQSKVTLILNPKYQTKKKVSKSKFIIYLKE
jgi:hypothetical protein